MITQYFHRDGQQNHIHIFVTTTTSRNGRFVRTLCHFVNETAAFSRYFVFQHKMSKPKNEDSSNLDVVERYETYEDYLDSQLTANDMGYLEDEEMARQLVELGYRGLGDTIHRPVRET